MYKVIKFFTDLKDGNHAYNVGDIYPRDGVAVSKERIAELANGHNKQRVPLIREVEEPKEEPKPKKGKKK